MEHSAVLQLAEYCLRIAAVKQYDPPVEMTEEEAWEDAMEFPEWEAIQELKRDRKSWPMYLKWLTVEEGDPLPGAEPYWREHHDPAPNDPHAYDPIEIIPKAELDSLDLNPKWDYTDYRTATNVVQTIMTRLMDRDFEQTDW